MIKRAAYKASCPGQARSPACVLDQTQLRCVRGSGRGAGGAEAFMPPSLATQRPDSSSFTQHSQKSGSCAQLGFSLANVARGSSPASELFGHKRLHLPLKRKAAPALAWPRSLHPCWPLPTRQHARMSVCWCHTTERR